MNGTASDRVRLSLKSTRSAIRSPTADRTAATRPIPSDAVPDTLILAERKPRPSHPIASCAARSGGTVHAVDGLRQRHVHEDRLDADDAHGARPHAIVTETRASRRRSVAGHPDARS